MEPRLILALLAMLIALQLKPGPFTLEMTRLPMKGVEALTAGCGKLSTAPAQASVDADATRKAERMAACANALHDIVVKVL